MNAYKVNPICIPKFAITNASLAPTHFPMVVPHVTQPSQDYSQEQPVPARLATSMTDRAQHVSVLLYFWII